MNAQAASIGSLISVIVLSDYRVLRKSWATPFAVSLGWADLREPTYLAYQPWAARFPDHVFESAWRLLVERNSPHLSVPLAALQGLSEEFLELRHGTVRLRRTLLGAWQQGIASRISSLSVQATADVHFDAGRYAATADSLRSSQTTSNHLSTKWRRQVLPVLRPDEAPVADYIEREGLHETHLHLNGSTHAEICWLRAVRAPQVETRDFVKAWTTGPQASRLSELVEQASPGLTPVTFFQHLRVASRLRTWLVAAAEDRIRLNSPLPSSCQDLCDMDSEEWTVGLSEPTLPWNYEFEIEDELIWMARLVAKLRVHPSIQLSRMFHSYLLLSNEYYKFLVQSEAQYGFDQFQKFTLTELREPAEKDYRARFRAMHGTSPISTVGYLEGRFAPKDNSLKACRLLHSILSGYFSYLHDVGADGPLHTRSPRSLSKLLAELEQYFANPASSHRDTHRLALVAHFIKQPWPPAERHKAGPYRHYPLDLQLRRSTGVLLSMIARWPRLRTWVRGIDAAANELHAPPDVFASTFRVCKRAGLTHRSYHAGEDFRHLLSGLATMWEALTLLDLRDGDRIGHGTAMGIRPSLWLDRMPNVLTLTRGEWMLSVLAAWQLIRNLPAMQTSAHLLQRELEEVADQVFRRSLSAHDIERAMALRGLSRHYLKLHCFGAADAHEEPLSELWQNEEAIVRAACKEQRQDVQLLWEWLSNPAVQMRADEWISKDARFLDASVYIRLQQALMQQVSERGVLIETLPSSNVRISQYHSVDEHHSLRWMRVPGHVEDGDPEIMTCLGSDDPGIFAGDLETEFYLLYSTLRQSGLDDSESMQRLGALNERGRTYRFHDRSLS